jgi:hypothetical protein
MANLSAGITASDNQFNFDVIPRTILVFNAPDTTNVVEKVRNRGDERVDIICGSIAQCTNKFSPLSAFQTTNEPSAADYPGHDRQTVPGESVASAPPEGSGNYRSDHVAV